jgi:histidyl-tRNA synthetase
MNSTLPKPSLKPQLPRGFADRGPGEIAAVERMLAVIRETYELYGFEAVETPFIEYTDALGKFLPDQDRPNEGVFSFRDDDEQWLSLRYDLTAPLARYVAENFDRLPKPYRSYRAGFVFRNEKPGPGRFRQFMQFDADTVGAPSVIADAEMCMMAADTLERLGIKRGDYVIKVNNRKVLDGVMEAIGLGGPENVGRRLTVLRAIDKLDRLGVDGVHQLLGAGRKDESGDFTKGAGLSPEQIQQVLRYFDLTASWSLADARDSREPQGLEGESTRSVAALKEPRFSDEQTSDAFPGRYLSNAAILSDFETVVGISGIGRDGVNELREIIDVTSGSGYKSKRIRIDPSVVRGLEYYTGPVFEAELAFGVKDERGNPVRFGSVGGGGRYDGLVARFRGEPIPATGFSIGVSRLYAALKLIDSPIISGADLTGPVVVLVLDRDQIARYQSMVSRLRDSNIRAELYLGSAGMKAQMRYADRRKSPCVVIQGSDERTRGEVQIKDLVEGARAAVSIASNEEWKAARPAQISAPEDKLVETVRQVLARPRT